MRRRLATSRSSWVGRWASRSFELLGYGYRPWLALVWLALLVFAYGALLGQARFIHAVTSVRDHPGANERALLAVDQLLPFASIKVSDHWSFHPTGWQWVMFAVLMAIKFTVWATAALALGSVTGLIKKD